MNMTKEVRTELREMKKRHRALAAELVVTAKNCKRARLSALRKYTQSERAALKEYDKVVKEMVREERTAKRSAETQSAKIVARIALLEGRLP